MLIYKNVEIDNGRCLHKGTGEPEVDHSSYLPPDIAAAERQERSLDLLACLEHVAKRLNVSEEYGYGCSIGCHRSR